MTTRKAFTPDEWETLLVAPMSAGMYVLLINLNVMGFIKSAKALNDAISAVSERSDNTELLRDILADYQNKELMKQFAPDLYDADPELFKEDVLEHMQDAVDILQEKATAEESRQIRQWIFDLVLTTARATRDGGFLGIGSVRLNDQEKSMLADIGGILDIETDLGTE